MVLEMEDLYWRKQLWRRKGWGKRGGEYPHAGVPTEKREALPPPHTTPGLVQLGSPDFAVNQSKLAAVAGAHRSEGGAAMVNPGTVTRLSIINLSVAGSPQRPHEPTGQPWEMYSSSLSLSLDV